ncbi:MAG: DUF2723 domain-containing protein [Saprospiraceae bacterium]|nr:DUF2723 domain-containing protein [Saprospiraceae bacterium]
MNFKKLTNYTGVAVFIIAFAVFFMSAERTGSLWDCGEFVLGAYKLQVVHPPGAPMFLLIGRLFGWVGDILSDNPSNIAFAVNLMSSLCTALAAMFVCWITIILSKLALVRFSNDIAEDQSWACAGAGLVAGLATAFSTSVWFSAVEGEVYAMSTFFTAMTFWAVIKWYNLPNERIHDKWLIFAVYSAGLSTGVHLLSLLTFPALAIFYYFKKFKKHTTLGVIVAALSGALAIAVIQKVIIVGIPTLWTQMELLMVNGLGLPFHTGIIPTILIIAAILYFMFKQARTRNIAWLEQVTVALFLLVISFSTFATVVIRANANPPINMNNPSDAMRLLPYLNREQYGERPLLRGPDFTAQPIDFNKEDRYGKVGDRYEIVDQKISYKYKDSDKILFPRIAHSDQGRKRLHRRWMRYLGYDDKKDPSMGYNMSFLWNYQLGWMYWRYFMWNFVGRQNGDQGFYPWNLKDGNWRSGVKFVDEAKLYNQDKLTDAMLNNKARNSYYFLPLILGLIGMIFHFRKDKNDFLGLLAIFVITGIGIIIYSNQPPNEPRERDYVLVGSFFTFCIWIGMSVVQLFELVKKRGWLKGKTNAIVMTALVLIAPMIMAFENFDDHSRRHHKGARDYAANFLNSLEENAIIFTYGDNDTYPLWYAQEVEGIRPDVRVLNLSLIAVDWYIDQARRKINESPAVKMTVPQESYRGGKRNTILYFNKNRQDRDMPLLSAIKFIGEKHPVQGGSGQTYESYLPSRKLYIPVDVNSAIRNDMIYPTDTNVVDRIPIDLTQRNYITKDDLAVLDIIASNIWDRPIYFSVTCQESKLQGLQDYMQLEGLGLRIVPIKSKSDKSFYIYGSGRVDKERTYDVVQNEWEWGNFDKMDLYVNTSYMPAVQAMRMIIMRTAQGFLREGQNQKAVDMVDKYFEGFPNMNFPYNATTAPLIGVYEQTGNIEKLKEHLSILAENTRQELEFLQSIDNQVLQGSFRSEQAFANQAARDCMQMAQSTNDDAYINEINSKLSPFVSQKVRN